MSGFVLPIAWHPDTVRPDVMQVAMLGCIEVGRIHVSGRSASWASPLTKHPMIWASVRSAAAAKEAVERRALEWVLAAGLRPSGHDTAPPPPGRAAPKQGETT